MSGVHAIAGAIVVAALTGQTASGASPHCMTRIINDAPAKEAPEEVMSKSNGEFGPVVEIKVDKKTGQMTYCAKSTYCYVANAFEFTSPCRIKRDLEKTGETYFSYFTR